MAKKRNKVGEEVEDECSMICSKSALLFKMISEIFIGMKAAFGIIA